LAFLSLTGTRVNLDKVETDSSSKSCYTRKWLPIGVLTGPNVE